MRSTSRMTVWASILVSAVAAGLLAVAGCALDKPQNQPRQVFNRIGGHGGQIIEQGSHDELLALNGQYAELWSAFSVEPTAA